MLADTKGVVGPTEHELQEDGHKGDGLERREQKPREESKDLPKILPPCQQEQAGLCQQRWLPGSYSPQSSSSSLLT